MRTLQSKRRAERLTFDGFIAAACDSDDNVYNHIISLVCSLFAHHGCSASRPAVSTVFTSFPVLKSMYPWHDYKNWSTTIISSELKFVMWRLPAVLYTLCSFSTAHFMKVLHVKFGMFVAASLEHFSCFGPAPSALRRHVLGPALQNTAISETFPLKSRNRVLLERMTTD